MYKLVPRLTQVYMITDKSTATLILHLPRKQAIRNITIDSQVGPDFVEAQQ